MINNKLKMNRFCPNFENSEILVTKVYCPNFVKLQILVDEKKIVKISLTLYEDG